jgi:D-alanyl-D-alanine carboxypeptidase
MPENRKNSLVVLLMVVALLVGVALIAAMPGHSQSTPKFEQTVATQQTETATKLTAATRPRSVSSNDGAVSPAFAAAATENASLRATLGWQFGGKQQRGWYLYTSLINQTLATDSDPSAPEFAQALARWQKNAGLPASGVLDNDTWFKMFSTWQSRRLKNKSYAQPDQLVTAPATDFWDETRPEELRKVEREAYAAYKRMIAAAAADPTLRLAVTSTGELAPTEKYLKIISSFRSREYQEQLRRQSPTAGSAGLAVNSPHFTARALDLYVGGEPVSTKDANRAIQVQTPVYKWLVRNAERFGFRPYYYEPWHWEYVGEIGAERVGVMPAAK